MYNFIFWNFFWYHLVSFYDTQKSSKIRKNREILKKKIMVTKIFCIFLGCITIYVYIKYILEFSNFFFIFFAFLILF